MRTEFPTISGMVLNILMPFCITYLCEAEFSASMTIKPNKWAGETAHWVKVLATKPGGLSLIPRIHVAEGKRWLSLDYHVCALGHTHAHTHTYTTALS